MHPYNDATLQLYMRNFLPRIPEIMNIYVFVILHFAFNHFHMRFLSDMQPCTPAITQIHVLSVAIGCRDKCQDIVSSIGRDLLPPRRSDRSMLSPEVRRVYGSLALVACWLDCASTDESCVYESLAQATRARDVPSFC